MKILRRLQVVAGIIGVSAVAGAAAGLLVAAAMLATQIGHARPTLIWELVKLGSQTGALFGVLVGPPTILGLLRRVPLDRMARNILIGVTGGGLAGFALSLAFAQPRPEIAFILSGSLVGFALATLRLRRSVRALRDAVPVAAGV